MSTPAVTSNILRYHRPSSTFSPPSIRPGDETSRQREARYQAVLHSVTDAIVTANSSGIITEWNTGAERMFGYNSDEVAGQPFTLLMPRDFHADYENGIKRLQSGENAHIAGKTVELKGIRKDGSIFPMELSVAPWQSTCETFYTSIIRDITDRKRAEEALKESERRYHDFLDNAVQGVFQSSVDGRLIYANASLLRMLGYASFEELASRDLAEVYVVPSDRKSVSTELSAKGSCSNLELRLQRKDGKVITVVENSRAVKDGSGNIVMFEGMLEDITDRKRTEVALAWEQYLLNALLDNVPDHIYFKDMESRFVKISKGQAEVFGLSDPTQAVGKTDFDFFTEAHARLAYHDEQVIIGGGVALSKEEKETWPDRPDSWVLTTKMPLRDKDENIIGTFGISRDITEHKEAEMASKRAEEVLLHERNQLRILIDNLPDLIYFKDADGRYVLNNRAHLRSLGVDHQDEVLGKTTFDFNPPEFARQYQEDHLRIVRTGEPLCEKEEPALHKDTGEQRWHLTSKIPLLDSQGTVTGVVGISRDITERKDLQARVQDSLSALQSSRESLAQLNAQKDRLFSVLSHDLRSPFTSILGFCEILITDGETLSETERKEFLTYICDAAQRQLALLNRLLDWSRLETGRIKLDIQEIELDSLVKSCLTTHLGTSKQKEITLRSTLPAMSMVRGDQVLLMQAFNNLLSNALKFTPKGGVISIDVAEEKEEEWVIAVKDTGRGIPKDDLRKLFKVEEKYTRPGLDGEQGSGLGLSLVYEIVRQHHGSITAESEPDKGTTFTIRLPRVVENKEHVVLVVDDDEGVRVLHSRYLKKMYPDAHVIQASNGREAFALAKQYKPRIIVTDYSMPEMNGYEFLSLLKGEQTTKHIPVFVITGKGSTGSSDTLKMSGAAAVLDKPVPSKTLQETIEKVLAERI